MGGRVPPLVRLESIGQSYESRGIWLCTVTNADTGPAEEKPAAPGTSARAPSAPS